MNNKRLRVLPLLFALMLTSVQGQELSTENKIALPSKQYLLKGGENKIFVQTFIKNDDLGDIVRFEGDMEYAKGSRMEDYVTIKNPNMGDEMEVKLYDGVSLEVKDSALSQIIVGDPEDGDSTVRVQFLGDSYTRGCYFRSAFIDRGLVPNVKLIGTRVVTQSEGQYHEGRGGWRVSTYFSQEATDPCFHNPYYQPTELGLYYWGSVEFWQKSVEINTHGSQGLDFNTRYHCGDYNTELFGEDGLLISPQKGDMMYSGAKGGYIVWNGRRWRDAEEPEQWDFDYGKYLKMWGFESPEFLVVMLGLNDFRDNPFPLEFEVWNERVERILTSYRAAVPQGRLLLCTPCTSCGTLNNETGQFTTRQNRAMWYVRENIIKTFDCREDEGLYVVDASATIDNENGYNMKGDYQVGNPHPYPNYPSLAEPIAACVQYYREK